MYYVFKLAYKISIASIVLILLSRCNTELKELRFDYNAFPDVAMLNGNVYCVFYNGWEHGSFPEKDRLMSKGGGIYLAISSDSGRSWTTPKVIIDTPFDDRDPSLLVIENRLICSFFQVALGDSKLEFNTSISESYDGGNSWSTPRLVAKNFATSSPILKTKSNKIILAGYLVDYNNRGECYTIESNDNCRTWSNPKLVLKSNNISLSEPSIVEFGNRLIIVARSDDHHLNMQSTESNDNGITWSQSNDLGFPGEAPYLLNVGDTVLLLAKRHPLTNIRLSGKNEVNFSDPYIIDDGPGSYGAYPSIVHLNGNKFLISYYIETIENQRAEIRFRYCYVANSKIVVSDVVSNLFIEPLFIR